MAGKSANNRKLSAPFAMKWIDSCYQETLLPGAPWQKLSRELCDTLAGYLERQMGQPQRAAVLSRILGAGFMTEYFPQVFTSLASHPVDMAAEDERKLLLEASSWLKSQLLKAAHEVGMLVEEEGEEHSQAMKDYLNHIHNVFYIGLQRQLYLQDIEELSALRQAGGLKTPSPVKRQQVVSPAGSSGSAGSTPISSVKADKVGAHAHSPFSQPPSITSRSIDLIAKSVVKLLEKNPKKLKMVANLLHGRLLPPKLRVYVWTEGFLKAERDKLTQGANVERILRERFGKTVARNVGQLRLTRATQSPISRLIENSVVEVYERVPALASSRSEKQMKMAIKALNVLYTYDQTYEPYLIFWLFPLQLALSEHAHLSGPEHAYELAMYLDVLNSSLFVQWSQVYAISDLVMHQLLRNDREFHDHLQHICQLNTQLNTEDFIVEHLAKERREAQKLLKKPAEEVDPQRLLSDPRIYIRKWIGEGFVSVLDAPAVMFVWDQLFLQDWSSVVLQDFTLVLLLLLRERLMMCEEHMNMRLVLLQLPCRLLLADIQRAWLMLHEHRPYIEIAACNRVRPPHTPGSASQPTALSTTPITPLAATDIISPAATSLPPTAIPSTLATVSPDVPTSVPPASHAATTPTAPPSIPSAAPATPLAASPSTPSAASPATSSAAPPTPSAAPAVDGK